jgi:thioredoxin-like negative regulator of GroEL
MSSSFHRLDHADLRAALDVPGLVLLDFWQASCVPCRALEPRLEQIAQRRSGEFLGYRIDVGANPAAAGDFDVQSIPTLILLRDGREVTRLDGLIRDHDVEEALDAHRPATSARVPQ